MNKQNYDAVMQGQIKEMQGKKKLLLHCCCAPCSSACLERLKDYFFITVLFYNPNIEDKEYELRKSEVKRLITQTGWADFLDCDRDGQSFYSAVRGLENQSEGGARCEKCFYLRLKKTAETAQKLAYDYFTTTLTISPLKNAEVINEIGANLQGEAKWLYSDFKKRNGYLRSLQLSKQYNLYRQSFCGCVFSRIQSEKLAKHE